MTPAGAGQPAHTRPGTERAGSGEVRSGDHVLTAFFTARAEVSTAVASLLGSGIDVGAIRVLPKSVHHLDDLGVRPTTRAPEGAALGALAGGLAGAIAGTVAAGGAIVVPILGAVLAGPMVAALAGAGAGGALGMIAGALVGARFPGYEAAFLENAVRTGGALVAVRCAGQHAGRIAELLRACGAIGVRRR